MDTFNCRSTGMANKYWYTTSDGEFAMLTGGMRYYRFVQPSAPGEQKTLPEFLTPEATRHLYRLPAVVNFIRTIDVGKDSTSIDLSMTRAGRNANAAIYYGEHDCLTFAKRELHGTERSSAVSKSTQADDRSWSNRTEIKPLTDGSNLFRLVGLKPDTTYYYRALVTNAEGQVWTFKTKTFRTK